MLPITPKTKYTYLACQDRREGVKPRSPTTGNRLTERQRKTREREREREEIWGMEETWAEIWGMEEIWAEIWNRDGGNWSRIEFGDVLCLAEEENGRERGGKHWETRERERGESGTDWWVFFFFFLFNWTVWKILGGWGKLGAKKSRLYTYTLIYIIILF